MQVRNVRGMALLEVLIALALLAGLSLSVIHFSTAMMQKNRAAYQRVVAKQQQELALLKK